MPPDVSTDLSALSDTERDILRLLAEGHTAKSIATRTGRSTNSVNERLRDARRKTGMGSSRELARLLREQENRDEKIGVADGAEPSSDRPEAPGTSARRIAKGSIMALGTLAVLAAVALSVGGQQTPQTQASPAVGQDSPSADEANPFSPISAHELHARLRTEPRDPAWADAAEAALRTRFGAVEGIAQGDALRVTCGSTACEVAGGFVDNATPQMRSRATAALQAPPLTDDFADLGLSFAVAAFHSATKSTPHPLTFGIFWQRDSD